MKLTDFKVVTKDMSGGKKHFYKWNPQLDIGANISMNQRLNSKVSPFFLPSITLKRGTIGEMA